MQKEKQNFLKFKTKKKIIILFLMFSFLTVPYKTMAAMVVEDVMAGIQREWIASREMIAQTLKDAQKTWLSKIGTVLKNSILRNTLNQIAYDAATYVGSGGKGQKPQFLTSDWESYMLDAADNAMGQVLEDLGKSLGVNFCNPDLSFSLSIGLGLTQYRRPEPPKCSFTKVVDNWDQAIKEADFLNNFQDMFNPTSNELGISLTVQSDAVKAMKDAKDIADKTRTTSGGWVDNTNVAGESVGPPGESKENLSNILNTYYTRIPLLGESDLFIEAADIFTNQLALSSFQNLIRKLGEKDKPNSTKTIIGGIGSLTGGELELKKLSLLNKAINNLERYFGSTAEKVAERTASGVAGDVDPVSVYTTAQAEVKKNAASNADQGITRFLGIDINSLSDSDRATIEKERNSLKAALAELTSLALAPSGIYNPESDNNTGKAGIEARFRDILLPDFTSRGDYNLLAELTLCPNPNKAGVNNCVINDRFSQAVNEKLTVKEALEKGYLNANGVFGFGANGIEPDYNTGYPYRSMTILRKHRIIPIGWELAAQYIKASPIANGIGICNLGDLVSCFDANDDYSYKSKNCNFDLDSSDNWCTGLVDPNWVLKVPLGYCKRSGYGADIVYSGVIAGADGTKKLAIQRSDNYCADEQSCIKENDDGSCEFYGYCVEEKREWDFDGKTCEPIYNTCETFSSANGKKTSYLKNTIDYSNCEASVAGCHSYCSDYDYNNSSWNCDSKTGEKMYFDNDAEACSSDAEGCSEFIRTKANLGTNLVINSSFEATTPDGWIKSDASAEISSAEALFGRQSFKTVAVVDNDPLILSNLSGKFKKGEVYGASIWFKGGADSAAMLYFGDGTQVNFTESGCVAASSEWQRIEIKHVMTQDSNNMIIGVGNGDCGQAGSEVFYDGAQVEKILLKTSPLTNFKNYGSVNLVYEKLLPGYMEDACYASPGTDYRIKDNAPKECEDFARKCNQNEAGCELYTDAEGISIPAKVTVDNYCLSECSGYNTFIQAETTFDFKKDFYFIPATAEKCRAANIGCDEFTNMDAIGAGGEQKEYYSYLRQCVKPDDVQSDCRSFYTWEGSNDTGYQLKVFSLQLDDDAEAGDLYVNDPKTTSDDSSLCDATIYNLKSTDPAYNPDCREFFNKEGGVSYHLYTKTITCSDDCHAYRRSAVDFDPSISTSGACVGDDRNWDTEASKCAVCKNGGKWNDQQQACLYYAIPGEGKRCEAESNGCREYSGNSANNVKTILQNDFEGSMQGWTGFNGSSVSLSNEALVAGGQSLKVNSSTALVVGSGVAENKSYILSFVAKNSSVSSNNLEIKFSNSKNEESLFGGVTVKNDWGFYKVNLDKISHAVDQDEKLIVAGNSEFYIDNIKISEVRGKYYLIKDSWKTPASCDQDLNGNSYPLYALGCGAYEDRDENIHYLKSFDSLCQSSAVGCEQLINTKNSKDYSDDNLLYAVYDRGKECDGADKGCQMFGYSYEYDDTVLFRDVYLKNNPDNYERILCAEEESGCAEWASEAGLSYFKDPGLNTCAWRQSKIDSNIWDWFKSPSYKCDDQEINGSIDNEVRTCDNYTKCNSNPVKLVGNYCDDNRNGNKDANEKEVRASAANCSANIQCISGHCDDNKNGKIDTEATPCISDNNCGDNKCLVDINDYKCDTSDLKTFGLGGAGKKVSQPSDSAGLCPTVASGCVELIDPKSEFNPYLDVNNGEVSLEPYTLYILTDGEIVCDGKMELYVLGDKNKISSVATTVSAKDNKILFYTKGGDDATCTTIDVDDNELREAVVGYQLKDSLNYGACDGQVNFEKGCILFNERSVNGDYNKLVWDVYSSSDRPVSGNNNSNAIIKVRPDRVCGQWLACSDFENNPVDGPVCLDIGLCELLDENGNCSRWVGDKKCDVNSNGKIDGVESTSCIKSSECGEDIKCISKLKNNYTYSYSYDSGGFLSMADIANMSGYVKAGIKDVARDESTNTPNPNDYYNFGDMNSYGFSAKIRNNGFELVDSSGVLGWDCVGGAATSTCRIITDPTDSGNICVKKDAGVNCPRYAPEGSNYVTVGADKIFTSQEISVGKNAAYVLSFYTNTERITSGTSTIEIIGGSAVLEGINISYQEPWKFKVMKFNAGNNDKITIKVSGVNAVGLIYLDGFSIASVLDSNLTTSGGEWLIPPSCRLYPKSDSLSCDYFDEQNKRYKGWEGYCLEYDRYPGSTDSCILWWPVPYGNRFGEKCGDNIVNGDEDCDCGSNIDGSSILYCDNLERNPLEHLTKDNQYSCFNCRTVDGWCGDDIVEENFNEECEGGGKGLSSIDQWGCSDCVWATGWCGDNILNGPEECDNGDNNSAYTTCNSAKDYTEGRISDVEKICKFTTCGDNIVQSPNGKGQNEQCDGDVIMIDGKATSIADSTNDGICKALGYVGAASNDPHLFCNSCNFNVDSVCKLYNTNKTLNDTKLELNSELQWRYLDSKRGGNIWTGPTACKDPLDDCPADKLYWTGYAVEANAIINGTTTPKMYYAFPDGWVPLRRDLGVSEQGGGTPVNINPFFESEYWYDISTYPGGTGFRKDNKLWISDTAIKDIRISDTIFDDSGFCYAWWGTGNLYYVNSFNAVDSGTCVGCCGDNGSDCTCNCSSDVYYCVQEGFSPTQICSQSANFTNYGAYRTSNLSGRNTVCDLGAGGAVSQMACIERPESAILSKIFYSSYNNYYYLGRTKINNVNIQPGTTINIKAGDISDQRPHIHRCAVHVKFDGQQCVGDYCN